MLYTYKPILFFDEIQNIAGWEHFARRLANQKYSLFITGSNAKMLSHDIATTLGARFLDEPVFPYSFAEFIGANNVQLEAHWEYGKTALCRPATDGDLPAMGWLPGIAPVPK